VGKLKEHSGPRTKQVLEALVRLNHAEKQQVWSIGVQSENLPRAASIEVRRLWKSGGPFRNRMNLAKHVTPLRSRSICCRLEV